MYETENNFLILPVDVEVAVPLRVGEQTVDRRRNQLRSIGQIARHQPISAFQFRLLGRRNRAGEEDERQSSKSEVGAHCALRVRSEAHNMAQASCRGKGSTARYALGRSFAGGANR